MSKEIIMAEITVAEAEAPVQAPDQDAIDTVKGVEKFLTGARNEGPNDGDDRLPPGVTRPDATTPDRHDAGGAAGGGGGDGNEGPPEDQRGLEYEASPERGREIAEEIARWEALRAAGRYNEVNWPRLNQLFREQEVHIEVLKRVSLDVKPYWQRPEQRQQITPEIQTVNPDRFVGFRPLAEWINEYRTGAVTDRDRFIREVNIYLDEAKRVGLLKDLDATLAYAYNRRVRTGIARKQTSIEIMTGNPRAGIIGVEQIIQEALNSLGNIYRDRLWTDPEIAQLAGIGDLYAQFARERFIAAINNQDLDGLTQRPYLIDKEFRLGQEGEGAPVETYWRTTQGWYIEIYAETEEEFLIAAETYISRLESITAAPEKIFEEATRFIDVLNKSEGSKKMSNEFLNALILSIEARVGVFGADQSNELYNADAYKKFMDFINKDGKGPDRWLELVKQLDAKVAAALWMLDRDPRWEILFSLFGSRGQLAKSSDVQRNGVGTQGLFAQAKNIFIEEMMGVAIKDKRDVANVTMWMSDSKFASMFDGLYQYGQVPPDRAPGDVNIRAFWGLRNIPDSQLTPDQREAKKLGGIQLQIRGGKKVEDLALSDREFYKRKRAEAEKAFNIAFQIYGALGEKSKRAGGVFKINRVKDGEEFQDFIPVHYAEKFVQFAETWTKMKYADDAEIWDRPETWNDSIATKIKEDNGAKRHNELKNFKAQYRAAKVAQARKKAIDEIAGEEETLGGRRSGGKGFEAKLYEYDDVGNVLGPMKLKRPKEDGSGVEEVPVTFYIATHHPYGDWTGHTYWSYQEEDRHRILAPTTFAEARKIRDGELRPEDADPWAIQLLILDPTLSRVRRFNKKNFEERERKLTMAAVEDSYQSHWRITRELYRAFFPKYGIHTEEIGIYYGLQDYGGFRKMIEHARARAAEDPERFARRGRRLIPDLHIPASALSEYLGVGSVGALGVIRMLGAPIYKMCGTFALDKFSAQADIANKQYESLFIATKDNEGNIVEPLLLKLTNDSDELQEYYLQLPEDPTKWRPKEQHTYRVGLRKSFGRLERYEKLISTIDTYIRNASGALWLEGIDVLTDNGNLAREIAGRFRTLPDLRKEDLTKEDIARFIQEAEEIERMTEEKFNRRFNSGEDNTDGIDEGDISIFTGSGRHSARIFHDTIMDLMLDEHKRGGVKLYPDERYLYAHLNDKVVFYNPNIKGGTAISTRTIKDWLFEKFVPT